MLNTEPNSTQKGDFITQLILLICAALTAPIVVFPLMIQFVMGIYQLVQNIVVLTRYKRLSKRDKRYLHAYWGLIVVWLTITVLNWGQFGHFGGQKWILFWVIIPWAIAIVNMIMTYIRVYLPDTTRTPHQFLNNIQL